MAIVAKTVNANTIGARNTARSGPPTHQHSTVVMRVTVPIATAASRLWFTDQSLHGAGPADSKDMPTAVQASPDAHVSVESPAALAVTGTVQGVGRKVDLDDLVNATGIAERAGLAGPQAVVNWLAREDDFPEPVAVYGKMKLWLWPDVHRWLVKKGKVPAGNTRKRSSQGR
jgi:uncharacterized protein with beta-barrel porin domain